MSMTRLEVFCNLDYRKDPFKVSRPFETGDTRRTKRILTMAVESRAMVSIVGDRGIGKSDAVNAALEKIGVKKITVEKAQKERVGIADIQKAMLLDLGEKPPKDGEIMSRKLRQVIGEACAKSKRPIVVLIEEAQRLHGNTLRSLKSLREMEWCGQKELFSVVMVAQSDPMNRAGVSEVKLRTDTIRMQGMTPEEAVAYVTATIGRHFEEKALEALGDVHQAANYLELQELCIQLLNKALLAGREQVTLADVKELTSSSQMQELPKTTRKQTPDKVAPASLKDFMATRKSRANDPEPDPVLSGVEGAAAC